MIKWHDKSLFNLKQANPAGQSSSILHKEQIWGESLYDAQILDWQSLSETQNSPFGNPSGFTEKNKIEILSKRVFIFLFEKLD